jgi:hypothetical protein
MRQFFIASIVLVACGGSITTVDGNDNTSSLSPVDDNQLCLDTFNYVKNSVSQTDIAELSCGFTQTQDPSMCVATYNTCVANALTQPNPLTNATPDCTQFNEDVKKCNTTVGLYTKCLAQEVNVIKSIESKFPLCTQAEAEAAEIESLQQLSNDCVMLLTSCNLTFVGSSSSSSSFDGGSAPDGG